MVKKDKPFMVIVSPMCGPCSALRSVFNYQKQDYNEVKNKMRDAMMHVKLCLNLFLEQHRHERLFMFEHTVGAPSWSMKVMCAIMEP